MPDVEWTVLDSVSFMVIILCHFSVLFLLATSGAC